MTFTVQHDFGLMNRRTLTRLTRASDGHEQPGSDTTP